MSDWLPNDDQICDAMQWRRTALSPALGQARCYLARVACLLDAWTELPGSRLPELERHTAIWAPTGPGALHRRLARALVHRATRSLGDLDLPAPIGAYYTAEFNRIRDDLAQRADGGFSFTRYRFKADLRLLAFRRIPLGMYDLDGATIPRQMLLRQKPWDAWRLTQMVLECAGISPFFSQHMVSHRLHLFNPEGRSRYLELLAQLLRRRPQIRGLTSTAWYNDPVVAQISPRLAYLREGLKRISAQTFRIGTKTEVVEDALAKSATQRRVYATGAYVPTAYLVVVPRACLLRAFDVRDTQAVCAR